MTSFQKGYSRRLKYRSTAVSLQTQTIKPDYKAPEGSEAYREVSYSDDFLANIPNPNDPTYTDEQLDAIDNKKKELFNHILSNLPAVITDRQQEILALYLKGDKTQAQIAAQLGIKARSSVSCSLFGQVDHYHKKRSGGSIPTLQAWAASDSTCKRLLLELQALYLEDK